MSVYPGYLRVESRILTSCSELCRPPHVSARIRGLSLICKQRLPSCGNLYTVRADLKACRHRRRLRRTLPLPLAAIENAVSAGRKGDSAWRAALGGKFRK